MKLLIIGASGFIGNATLDYFSKKYTVTGIDAIGNVEKNILQINGFKEVEELISKNKFDVIINCAGSSNVLQSFNDPALDFELNTMLVQQILDAIRKHLPAAKLINLSSAAVYGNPISLPVKETDPTHPLSPYGLHKLLSEQLISNYCNFYGLQGLSVRIFSAYGPQLNRQFFYDLYIKFNSGKEYIELTGTGKESRDFIFISDIVEAFDVLIRKGKFTGEIYNLSSGEESFIDTTAGLFAAICDYKGEIRFNQQQFEGYPLNWKAATDKINALGFSPKIKLDDGLNTYFNSVKNNQV